MEKTIQLPWPPSVNHYLKRGGRGKPVRTDRANKYFDAVFYLCRKHQIKSFGSARLSLAIEAHPPDKRKRDIDNLLKMPLDALQYAGVYDDDNQLDELLIRRCYPVKKGRLLITVREIEQCKQSTKNKQD